MTGGQSSKEARKTRDYNVGLPARKAVAGLLQSVLRHGQPLDEALTNSPAARAMLTFADRDRALARAITATTLRRKGQIEDVINRFLDRKLPKKSGALPEILLSAACQLLFMETPAHAAIDLAVTLAKQDRNARHYDRLANAVLRRVADEGPGLVEAQDAERLNTPGWLWERWKKHYGEETTRAIARAHLQEAALDLTVKSNPEDWTSRLGGTLLETGSIRLTPGGRVDRLDGFEDGAWWVQDAAAALPARLFGDISGKTIADLCAAPGGKTAQLAAAGAIVTAVDASADRIKRLKENMDRLKLQAQTVCADAESWRPSETFDCVLLDAPCSGTGTIRRHPDLPHLKSTRDVRELAAIQTKLLDNAVRQLKPHGVLVYCTCSLEPDEGEQQALALLERNEALKNLPLTGDDVAGNTDWIDNNGFLRTLPCHMRQGGDTLPGMDGFFAARLKKTG